MQVGLVLILAVFVICLALAALKLATGGPLLFNRALCDCCFVYRDGKIDVSLLRSSHNRRWPRSRLAIPSFPPQTAFVLMPTPDQRLLLRTGIEPPDKGSAQVGVDTADTVRVTYLDETSVLGDDPRAVRVEVLTGEFAGWSGSEDAKWFGWWIGVPGGFVVALASFAIAQGWKRESKSDPDDSSQTERTTP